MDTTESRHSEPPAADYVSPLNEGAYFMDESLGGVFAYLFDEALPHNRSLNLETSELIADESFIETLIEVWRRSIW